MREILQYPNPTLTKVSEPIESVDIKVREIAAELIRYLNQPVVVGISAIQLGEPIRMLATKRGDENIIIINPIVLKLSKQTYKVSESCASISHGTVSYLVTRHKSIKITGIDLNGKRFTYKGWNLFGQILQHEFDHLNGIMINTRGRLVKER